MSMPVLFVSHGSPMFALEPGLLGPQLQRIGRMLPRPAAVLVASPHWQTRGMRVSTATTPPTIHDFGGFAPELHRMIYPAAGAAAFARQAAERLSAAGFDVTLDPHRGLDHGTWVPLRYLFPDADVPVFQLSLPDDLDTAGALRLGRALAPLRESGLLIVGSGSMTHNLYEFRRSVHDPEYAQAFADWIRDAVLRRDIDALVGYRRRAPHAERAHPTEEHYLPLLLALGASNDRDTPRAIDGGMTYGTLSMDSFTWGMDDAAGGGHTGSP